MNVEPMSGIGDQIESSSCTLERAIDNDRARSFVAVDLRARDIRIATRSDLLKPRQRPLDEEPRRERVPGRR